MELESSIARLLHRIVSLKPKEVESYTLLQEALEKTQIVLQDFTKLFLGAVEGTAKRMGEKSSLFPVSFYKNAVRFFQRSARFVRLLVGKNDLIKQRLNKPLKKAADKKQLQTVIKNLH